MNDPFNSLLKHNWKSVFFFFASLSFSSNTLSIPIQTISCIMNGIIWKVIDLSNMHPTPLFDTKILYRYFKNENKCVDYSVGRLIEKMACY